MSYKIQAEIAANRMMQERVAQAVAEEGTVVDADRWTYDHRRLWASAPGWDAAWASAVASHPPPDPIPDDYVPYDPGGDEAVITDGMILTEVQSLAVPVP